MSENVAFDISVPLDILGLPSDVVSLILQRTGAFVGTRLGLASQRLLQWLDSNAQIWVGFYEQHGLNVKDFRAAKMSPKGRVVAGLTATSRMETASFDGVYLLQETRFMALRSGMQNGATFAVSTHSGYDAQQHQQQLRFGSLLDLSQWPEYKVTKFDAGTDASKFSSSLLGRKVLPLLPPRQAATSLLDLNHLFSDDAPGNGVPVTCNIPVADIFDSCVASVPSSDPRFDRIAIVGKAKEGAKNLVVAVYDFGSSTWSEHSRQPLTIEIPHVGRLTQFAFNGNYFAVFSTDPLVVISFVDLTNPQLLYSGEFPPFYGYMPGFSARIGLTSEYLVMCYHSHSGSPPWFTPKMAKVKLTDLDSTPRRPDLSACIEEFQLPFDTFQVFDNKYLFCHGNLAALLIQGKQNAALIVDLRRNRAVKSIRTAETVKHIAFLDDTLFLLFLENSIFAVDLLSRAGPARRHLQRHILQLFCTKRSTDNEEEEEKKKKNPVLFEPIYLESGNDVDRLRDLLVPTRPSSGPNVLIDVTIWNCKAIIPYSVFCKRYHFHAQHSRPLNFSLWHLLYSHEIRLDDPNPPDNVDIDTWLNAVPWSGSAINEKLSRPPPNEHTDTEYTDERFDVAFFRLEYDESDPISPPLIPISSDEAQRLAPQFAAAMEVAGKFLWSKTNNH